MSTKRVAGDADGGARALADAKQQAASDLTTAAASGAVSIPISPPMLLGQAAEAHHQVDIGTRERILLALPD